MFVQEVIAAITTEPSSIEKSLPATGRLALRREAGRAGDVLHEARERAGDLVEVDAVLRTLRAGRAPA